MSTYRRMRRQARQARHSGLQPMMVINTGEPFPDTAVVVLARFAWRYRSELAPLAVTVLARVTPQHAGAAAGVLSTVQQVGNALGVALLGIVFYGALGGGVPHAFRGCLIFLIVVELVLAALVQLLPKEPAGA